MKTKKTSRWSDTDDCTRKYREARQAAQAAANADGYDRGLERNDLFKSFSFHMLPRRENRYGHELRVEVVSCENIANCKPGHGPKI